MASSSSDSGGDNRLWIGNLDPRITEYQLLQILKRYGDIKELDFLFHKSGPNQGKPRGYCFVNYTTKEEAEKAMRSLDGKLALSKKLSVCWAQPHSKNSSDNIRGGKQKFPVCLGGQSGQVGSSKVAQAQKGMSADMKIKAIEAKLKSMEGNDDEFTVFPDVRSNSTELSRTKPPNKFTNYGADSVKVRHKPYDKKK
ncbi:probable RNA-binding protein 18 [Ptychodera flava]|uniref:probable RNA-binding protein 18 n=1 Tax=Ptychodera flava TaxID=63121 RepID=UPI003969ED9E